MPNKINLTESDISDAKNTNPAPEKKYQVGGQAVIEGVMMRSPHCIATAVRIPNGEIIINKRPFTSITSKNKFLGLPLIRGGVALIEALILGVQSLTWSAEQAIEEEDKKTKKEKEEKNTEENIEKDTEKDSENIESEVDKEKKSETKQMSNIAIAGTVAFSLLLGFALFFLLPLALTSLLGVEGKIGFNLVDGLIRLVIFLSYVGLISLWGEIRRIFQYHGAEHKSIYTLEAGKELVPINAKPFTTLHPRCGTSFLLIVMVISILIFSLLGKPVWWLRIISRIVLLPLIAGISYEFVKWSSKHQDNKIVHLISIPGLALQRLTTREPDEEQIEVAMAALKASLEE